MTPAVPNAFVLAAVAVSDIAGGVTDYAQFGVLAVLVWWSVQNSKDRKEERQARADRDDKLHEFMLKVLDRDQKGGPE